MEEYKPSQPYHTEKYWGGGNGQYGILKELVADVYNMFTVC